MQFMIAIDAQVTVVFIIEFQIKNSVSTAQMLFLFYVQLCIRAMASLETIGPLMNGMKKRADMIGLACEALNRMFQKEQNDLVAQVSKPF